MKKVPAVLLLLLSSTILFAQTKPQTNKPNQTSNTAWMKNIPTDDLIKWRRHIHENPEFSFKEEKRRQVNMLKAF
ncbi:hypothetical protein L1278_002495 [Pontibacter sp. HSC-36F09]|nr:hypothetical protein [Pontibacter sp. HSC-36F09]